MITQKVFDKLSNGSEITEFILDNGVIEAHILNYGCIIQSLFVADKEGVKRDVVLGYDKAIGYETNGGYLGAFIGRVGNRIKDSKFTLNGNTYKLFANDGKNSLHGGECGFDRKLYDAEIVGENLVLTAVSADGEEGYPGNLNIKVTYSLNGGAISMEYECTCDKDTPVSLTNHSYFNLSLEDTVLNHKLVINSDYITPVDKSLIPTGELMIVEDTPFDFRKGERVGEYIDFPHKQLKFGGGYDHNYVLKNYGLYEKVATLYSADTAIKMDVLTDNLGMQFYSGNFLNNEIGKGGRIHYKRAALCLETQGFPNAVNQPSFPSAILKAGETFRRKTTYSFSVQK